MIWNELEELRRRENARRGYDEVKTPLIYDKALWITLRSLGEVPREHVPDPDRRRARFGIKPMNCPGHMLLFGSALRSYRDLPLRYAEAAPLHRNELAGMLHGLTRVRHVTQDDAHIFCTQEQIEDGARRLPRVPRSTSTGSSGCDAELRALDAARQQARHRRGVGLHRGRAARRARAARHPLLRRRGRGLVLRAEDRPAHDRRARPLVADGHDPARRADAGAVRPHLRGRGQRRAHRLTSSTARCSARSSASSGS